MTLTLGPRAVERPADAGYSLVGALDDPSPARVDRAGSVQPAGAGFSIDWWIGADDRWYFPSREVSVRQRRLGAGPVIETAVRIPSGDAIHRAYPVSVGGATATVIEIENDSPVPVALAVAVRPYQVDGSSSHGAITIADRDVRVEGGVALCLPKRANERLATNREIAELVERGESLSGAAESIGEHPNAAVLYPLPHRTKLRFVVPVGSVTIDPSTTPDPEAVERGWTSVVERGGRFDLPDNGLSARASAARARLLLGPESLSDDVASFRSGRILQALAESGAGNLGSGEAVRLPLLALASAHGGRVRAEAPDLASLVSGAGRALAILDDRDLAAELLELLAGLTRKVEKSRSPHLAAEALGGLAWALLGAGQPEPAGELFDRAASLCPDGEPGLSRDLTEISAVAEQASGTGSFGNDDLEGAANFWLAVRRLAVVERPAGIDLLPRFPSGWRGGNVEVHEAVTTHGRVSFAVRWHGYRPALLWDLDLHRPVEVRCPSLDPSWSATEPKGEALLAGVEEELPAAPVEGQSFA